MPLERHEHGDSPSIDLVHEDEVRRWFDAYARALTTGDGGAVAAMWGLPALVLADQGVREMRTPGEVERFFAGTKGMYAARGVVDTRPDILHVEWLTSRVAVADVRWPLFDELHRELGAARATYTLARAPSGTLKLRVVVVRGDEGEGGAH